MKVYAVYSIPKSPEYRLDKLFKTKELAKEYIKKQKCKEERDGKDMIVFFDKSIIYDIQLEEVQE